MGAKTVASSSAPVGALIADSKRRLRLEPHPCKPVDATGAGDTFAGSLLARLVAGDDLETAARYASVAAALSTEGYGAMEPIPRAERVRGAIAG
jgi:2-dehydro-3-deoxygluconokinase